jgi:Fur family iron response transcriptional regulator
VALGIAPRRCQNHVGISCANPKREPEAIVTHRRPDTAGPAGAEATGEGARGELTRARLAERVKRAGLRPTRQRLALAQLLFGGQDLAPGAGPSDRHVTAEQLHHEAKDANLKVSLATVYNTLNQFTDAGLLREVVVEPGRSYFDTNVSDHHHFYHEDSGALQDIPGEQVHLSGLPQAPAGTTVDRVDVIIRVRKQD